MGMQADSGAHARSAASLVILSEAGHALLVDASPDLRHQQRRLLDIPHYAARQGREPFDGIALTHAHMGHYSGLVQFGRESYNANAVPCWVTPRMASFLEANQPWQALVVLRNLDTRRVEPGGTFEPWPGLEITSMEVFHRAEFTDTVAYSFHNAASRRSVLYVPDIDSWEAWPQIDTVIRQHDVAFVDGTFFADDELPERDMSRIRHPLVSTSAERFTHLATDTRIVYTHLNHTNPLCHPASPQRRRVEAAGFEVADDMMQVEF